MGEAEKAIEYAKKRAELLEAKRKKEEAARLERERIQKEKDDRAATCLAELEALVNGASSTYETAVAAQTEKEEQEAKDESLALSANIGVKESPDEIFAAAEQVLDTFTEAK